MISKKETAESSKQLFRQLVNKKVCVGAKLGDRRYYC